MPRAYDRLDSAAASGQTTPMPSVSIILPTFNRTAFLKRAVESASAQTWSDRELVIADDGSAEETREWLRSIESGTVRIVWGKHCGNPGRVRNAAIAAARGRYLAFLDSDDLWSPVKLERQLQAMERTGARWSFTSCDRIDEQGRLLSQAHPATSVPRPAALVRSLLDLSLAIPMPALVAEKSLVEELGGFDEALRYGEFHDLCLRMALRCEGAGLAEALCSVRAHQEHYSADRIAAHRDWMRLYEKMWRLVPDDALREVCVRMRAQMALRLASGQGARGELRAAWNTLRAGGVFALRHVALWPRAAAVLLRPARVTAPSAGARR
jgi:glycosyltransferase involved in cell wall biosynthesis